MFFLLCCFNGAARCHALVRFYVSLSGSSIVCEIFRRSLREHDCAILTTPEASLRELPYITRFFHNATIVIQRIRMYLRYDVRIHANIHTDTTCVLHVNVGLAQARPNYFWRTQPDNSWRCRGKGSSSSNLTTNGMTTHGKAT